MARAKTRIPNELQHIGQHHPASALGFRVKPNDMTLVQMDDDLSRSMHQIANSVFTDACNSGMPFQQALIAVYLSGLNHGVGAQKDRAAMISASEEG